MQLEDFAVKAAIVVFPGTNRERDMAIALRLATGHRPAMLWHQETALPDLDLVVIPGGFSHGDNLRCGAMAAQSPIMPAIRAFAERGGYVLGVCNGFQILTEAGMLPGALLRNAKLRFLSHDCHLRVERADTAFTRHYQRGQVFRAPLAHGDGNYFADADTLALLEDEDARDALARIAARIEQDGPGVPGWPGPGRWQVLWGGHDRSVPLTREVEHTLAAHLHRLPGSGHMPQLEEHERVNSLLLTHLMG